MASTYIISTENPNGLLEINLKKLLTFKLRIIIRSQLLN